jgi:hypothetical protein
METGTRRTAGYDGDGFTILPAAPTMKWALALCLVVLVLGLLKPGLASRLRLGRLPGDVRFRLRGREYSFPFTSTLLISLLAMLLFRWL